MEEQQNFQGVPVGEGLITPDTYPARESSISKVWTLYHLTQETGNVLSQPSFICRADIETVGPEHVLLSKRTSNYSGLDSGQLTGGQTQGHSGQTAQTVRKLDTPDTPQIKIPNFLLVERSSGTSDIASSQERKPADQDSCVVSRGRYTGFLSFSVPIDSFCGAEWGGRPQFLQITTDDGDVVYSPAFIQAINPCRPGADEVAERTDTRPTNSPAHMEWSFKISIKEIPTYSPNKLVKEFHKHRAERLCDNAYEEELLKYGYKVTSKEDVTFNALEITSQDLQILGSSERRINRQYSTTTSPCGEQVNNITTSSAMEQQVNQTLGGAAMELGALVGNIVPTTSTSPFQPTNNNANTQHVAQASSQAVAGLASNENKTGEVAPQVKPGSTEILASSSCEDSISGQACVPQHYTPTSQEGGYACAPMPTDIPCYPRFPQNYPTYPPPPYLPGFHPYYLDLISGQYVQPSYRCQRYGRVVYRPPGQPVLPQCHHAAPLPVPQCTHQHLSPSASCIQVAPTMGPSYPYGEQSPFSRCISVPVLTNHFGSLYYKHKPRMAIGVPGCRSECLPTSRRLNCTSCNVSDSSSCGPEPAAQASYHGGHRGQCGADANHGPVSAGALRSLYAPVPCPIGLQRRDALAQRPCSAPTRRVVPLTTQNQNSPFPSS